jgi:hypothetical protein
MDAATLLQMLLTLLAVNGVPHDAADAWHGWTTFKQYVRTVDEIPDPGVTVQAQRHADDSTSLIFMRQVLDDDGERLQPAGGVVLELNYDVHHGEQDEWSVWSFDHSTFDRFVDVVEQNDEFARLMVKRPTWSSVYWIDAD